MGVCRGTFLGTASVPTADRNSQSILLQFPGTSLLVDCGEGTQQQVLKAGARCAELDSIYLTHHHIDHIYGLGGVVNAALLHTDLDRLAIYGPALALKEARPLTQVGVRRFEDRLAWIEVAAGDVVHTPHFDCTCLATFHTQTSLGYVFKAGDAKLAFLGDVGLPDCSTIESIVSLVEGANILVSDAAHISALDAASIARKARVNALYLMPISWHCSEQQTRREAESVFSTVTIPNDLDGFTIEL